LLIRVFLFSSIDYILWLYTFPCILHS